MTDALQRTVRRCTALLLLPVSIVVVQVRRYVQYEFGYTPLPDLIGLGLPILLVAASALYLAGSFLVSGTGGMRSAADGT